MSLDIVLITGMSGSGKSVALKALEDVGYYCVDNLPPELLLHFVSLEPQSMAPRVAIAIDVRSAASLHLLPRQLATLREQHERFSLRIFFLDATTDTLVRRFSETRRRHPLSRHQNADQRRALIDTIELERELLADLREQSHVLDTSLLRSTQLQSQIKAMLNSNSQQLTLVFASFAFKRGIPVDADYVFDVRMLPNPHYEPELRDLSGRDPLVADFLAAHEEVEKMQLHIAGFLWHWLPMLKRDHRSYVTVALGCTGGQHRSVYLVEKLAQSFSRDWDTLVRHRELGH